jgi:hypothetical protein
VEIHGDFGRISKEILKVISCDLFEYIGFSVDNFVDYFAD